MGEAIEPAKVRSRTPSRTPPPCVGGGGAASPGPVPPAKHVLPASRVATDHIPGIDPHRINIHYFVVTLARLAYELFSLDYDEAFNPDGTKRSLGTIRPEFIAGSTGVLSRAGEDLIVRWDDPYEAKQHQVLTNLFHKLNHERQARLPFLGGLRIRYELGPPRPKTLTNRLRRGLVEF